MTLSNRGRKIIELIKKFIRTINFNIFLWSIGETAEDYKKYHMDKSWELFPDEDKYWPERLVAVAIEKKKEEEGSVHSKKTLL